MSIESIITGHLNEAFTSPEIEALSAERMKLCNVCPAKRSRPVLGLICSPSVKVEHVRTGKLVKGCSCRLAAKTRDKKEGCPAGKWGPVFE